MSRRVQGGQCQPCSLARVLSQALLTRIETPEPERKPDYAWQISQRAASVRRQS